MLMKYAVDQYGNLVHIDYVENGLACEAVCPDCCEPVIAKQGRSMDWFFSHRSGAPDCVSSNESTLHRVAKWLLRQEKRLVAPANTDSPSDLPRGLIVLADIKVELPVGLLTPDILATSTEGEVFAVEFAVTSFCNGEKVSRLHAFGMSVLEVDLSSFDHDVFDLADLKAAVCFCEANRKWLLPVPEPKLTPEEPPLPLVSAPATRFSGTPPMDRLNQVSHPEIIYVGRVPVYIRQGPWGNYAVWHPYNEFVRSVVEPACRSAGGRWDDSKWWVPARNIDDVRSRLRRTSGLRAA